MLFENICAITRLPIDSTAILVRVPTPKGTDQKNRYFYISDEAYFARLYQCPFTRRQGEYSYIKIASLNQAELTLLLQAKGRNELPEETDVLDELSVNFNWQKAAFALRPIPWHRTLYYNAVAARHGFNQGLNCSVLLAVIAAIFNTIPNDNKSEYRPDIVFMQIGAAFTVVFMAEFAMRRATENRHGFISLLTNMADDFMTRFRR